MHHVRPFTMCQALAVLTDCVTEVLIQWFIVIKDRHLIPSSLSTPVSRAVYFDNSVGLVIIVDEDDCDAARDGEVDELGQVDCTETCSASMSSGDGPRVLSFRFPNNRNKSYDGVLLRRGGNELHSEVLIVNEGGSYGV